MGIFDFFRKRSAVRTPDYRPLGRTGDVRYIPQIRRGKRDVYGNEPYLVYRLDGLQYDDLDRVRFYPVIQDGLDKFLAPLVQAKWHFNCPGNQAAVDLATQDLQSKLPELVRTIVKGAFEFGYQVVEFRWTVNFNVVVSSGGAAADGGPIQRTYPFINTVKRFAAFSPIDSVPLVGTRNGDFWGIRQWGAAREDARTLAKTGKLLHFVLDPDYDSVLGSPRTKSAVPFVEAVESVIDSMVLYSAILAGGIKTGRYPEGAAPGRTSTDKNANRDTMRANVENLDSFSTLVLPSTVWSGTDKYQWDLSITMPPAGSDNYIDKIDCLNGLIRQGVRMPEVASSESQEHGTYNLGEAKLDFYVKGLQGILERVATAINDQFLPWYNYYNFGQDAPPLKCYAEELDIDAVRTLLAGLLEWLKGGDPMETGDGQVIEVDWARLAQDKGLPVRIRKQTMADVMAKQLAAANVGLAGGKVGDDEETDDASNADTGQPKPATAPKPAGLT